MTTIYKNRVYGSPDLELSTAGKEIIPSRFANMNEGINYFKLYIGKSPCHISFNKGNFVYLEANQIFEIEWAYSCVILENEIPYHWIGNKRGIL
jgi:hypothetical protein